MTNSRPPLEELLSNLRQTLGALTPEPLLERMRPVLEGFFAQFELVPKRDFEAHLTQLRRLETTVAELEARLAELEASRDANDS